VAADELHGLRQSITVGKLDLLRAGPLHGIKTLRVAGAGPAGGDVATDRATVSLGRGRGLKMTILTSDAVLATYTNGAYGGQYQAAKRYSTTLYPREP
jgi:hypothetical protein